MNIFGQILYRVQFWLAWFPLSSALLLQAQVGIVSKRTKHWQLAFKFDACVIT